VQRRPIFINHGNGAAVWRLARRFFEITHYDAVYCVFCSVEAEDGCGAESATDALHQEHVLIAQAGLPGNLRQGHRPDQIVQLLAT
jgi:hypothetical protein